MSTDRPNSKPLRPTLASNCTATTRTPLTPRVAGSATLTSTPTTARPAAAPRLPSSRSTPVDTSRLRPQDTPTPNTNVTPRSSARRSRVGVAHESPVQEDEAGNVKTRRALAPADGKAARNSAASGLGVGTPGLGIQNKSRTSRPNSIVSERTAYSPPLSRSPGFADLARSAGGDSIESRFFHASDALKQEPVPKRPEPKKTPTFFYADGKEDKPATVPVRTNSPVLSAVSEKRSGGPRMKFDQQLHSAKSPPMLSPAMNQSNASVSYFPPTVPQHTQLRSPSPSKENIHLSYRKGVSQVFGTRPVPRSTPSLADIHQSPVVETPRRPSGNLVHRKSSSLSSINSASSQSHRCSSTVLDAALASSPLTHEFSPISISRVASPPTELPSIDTSLASPPSISSPLPDAAMSPTKAISQLAADARRERKVLDLEISNSSLMAINSSLEREIRRQKVELKRFRRLSRAGRFSMASNDVPRRASEGLETLGEEDSNAESTDILDELEEDDLSDSEDSLLSSEALSPGSQTNRQQDRLAKDEKRLRVDLERHKELLVQTQSMNQSLKRCMYATDDMIREGRKALEYHVRVSDVKLGGRILNEDDDDLTQDIEVRDEADTHEEGIENAESLLDVWREVGRPGRSEGSGDRDSGIEVDKAYSLASARYSNTSSHMTLSSGRPPETAI